MSSHKTYTIFAGVNGAGKSTFYKTLGQNYGVRINLDEIIKDRFDGLWDDSKTQMNAGRVAIKLIRECISGDKSFNQETTLTGHTIVTNIKKAKANGFKINLFYVGLSNVDLSIKRVALRVIQGGHGVPEDDLRRRYTNSFSNLQTILPLCDNVRIYDNSGDNIFDVLSPILIVKDEEVKLWDENCPAYLKNVIQEYVSGML